MWSVACRRFAAGIVLDRFWSRVAVLLAGIVLFPSDVSAQTQINQGFVSEGPSPSRGPFVTVQSNDQPPNGQVAGAVGPIVTDPTNPNTYYIGSPEGGVWKTRDGGVTWTPLTDKQASLSIASLALDPTDPSHNTLIAGTGLTSNGSACSAAAACLFSGSGGLRDGLLYSQDGGATWRQLGATTLANQSVVGVAARGNDILAATFEISGLGGDTRLGGLYRSTDGGATFAPVTGATGSGLPTGPVSSLVGDPTNASRLYAAVTSRNTAGNASTAVYVSNDTGATWTPVFNAANSNGTIQNTSQTVLKIATGPGGAIAVGVVDLVSHAVTGLFWSGNAGASWTKLQVPVLNPLGQAPVNFAIAIDPNNKNLVYVSGDEAGNGSPFPVSAFRINAITTNFTSITEGATANGSTVHADSRAIAFDANGRLLLSSDGTIYARTNPQNATGSWSSIGGNLSLFENYSVTYDAVGKRLMAAAQDNGVTIQSARNAPLWNAVEGADGTNAFVNDVTLKASGYSVFYGSGDSLSGATRFVLDKQSNPIGTNNTGTYGSGTAVTCGGADCGSLPGVVFESPWVANRIDPTRMALAGDHVYVTQDTLTGAQGLNATTVDLTLTDLGAAGTGITRIAFGTRDNPDMLVAGGQGADKLYQSTTAASNSIVPVLAYAPAGGLLPTGIVLDPRSQFRYFVVDNSNLFGTINQGASFTKLTANLPASIFRPASLEFIANNGVNALVVGGLNNVANAQSTIAVADSDSIGSLSNWRPFGTGLPNSQVTALSYNAAADVLAVGTFGRGAYALYDVTSYFVQASVLQFGLADNDSMPDASFLTNGNLGHRPLIKYGSGTLTIAGDATYSGGTTINGGAIVIGNGGTSGSIIGNVTFCANAADPSCDASTGKALAFNRSDIFSFAGSVSGPGQLFQIGSGTTVLTGTSTYSGPTSVDAGTLMVNGSIISQVTVNAGGTLGGNGTVGSTAVNNGGMLSPGSPVGTLTVQGTLSLAAASAYLVQIGSSGASRTNVTGSATLAGTVFASYLPGGLISRQNTIINAGGGVIGSFGTLASLNLPPTVSASLSYDANDAFLNLALNYAAVGPINANQANVANALTGFFNTNGSIPGNFAALTPAGLSQIAGETSTGSQQTTFAAMTQFITTLLDPFIGGRADDAAPATGVSAYTEANGDASAYASSSRFRSKGERDAYGIVTKAVPRNPLYDPHWSVWTAGFGGSQTTDGSGATGSNAATSRVFGTAAGADYVFSPRTIAGFALAGGASSFSVASAGSGRSDLFQAGVFVKHTAGAVQISGALAYGWQDINTDRTVTVAGVDRLHAEFNANAISGRLEGGYRFVTPWNGGIGITPYAAAQFTTFDLPAYAESVLSGTNAFALAYGAKTVTDARSELGVRTDRSFALADGILTLRNRFAWAHDFNPDRSIGATFQALPGASFVVNGAAQARDSALTTASAEMKWMNGWSAAATFEGEFSNVTRSYAGKGVVRYQW